MGNKNKAKGTRAESAVVKYLKDHGIQAERRTLTGNKDQGDIKVIDASGNAWIIEVKTGKQTHNPSRSQLEEWMRQTREEAYNAGMHGILCVVRYNRKIVDADVYIDHSFLQFGDEPIKEHMYLDQLAKQFV